MRVAEHVFCLSESVGLCILLSLLVIGSVNAFP
jgi:hypothetical protein